MMSTAVRLMLTVDLYDPTRLCKSIHANHPVSVWLRSSLGNWEWTFSLATALHNEWKFRYGHPVSRVHKSYEKILYAIEVAKIHSMTFSTKDMTPFALAMPEEYKTDDPVESYRNYYNKDPHKVRLASWKHRSTPEWWTCQTA